MSLRPLLACTLENVDILRLPALVSAKLDGFRCLNENGVLSTRNGKPIRNRYINQSIGLPQFAGMDGELIVGPSSGDGVFNRTSSGVTAADGEPDFTYWVFDNHLIPMAGFATRYKSLFDYPKHPRIQILPHMVIHTTSELATFETNVLAAGFEGVMIRRPDGPYKQGRSTLSEQLLLRVKRFRDGEARVTGVEEGKINENEPTLDNLGYTERSTHQANMRKAGRVGTILATDLKTGEPMRISPGRMTQDMRKHHWVYQDLLKNRIAKYKCFDYGAIDAPRFATFQAFLDGRP